MVVVTVDPFDLPDHNLTRDQQEWLWLFALAVAGKRADQTRQKVSAFLDGASFSGPPFDSVRAMVVGLTLGDRLRAARMGQYNRLERAYAYSVTHMKCPTTATLEDLEACPGCGPKTARFFLLSTRPRQRLAALDTHVLKFLRDSGYEDVPRSTPPAGWAYKRLEEAFLYEADRRVMDPAALDSQVWQNYARGSRVLNNHDSP